MTAHSRLSRRSVLRAIGAISGGAIGGALLQACAAPATPAAPPTTSPAEKVSAPAPTVPPVQAPAATAAPKSTEAAKQQAEQPKPTAPAAKPAAATQKGVVFFWDQFTADKADEAARKVYAAFSAKFPNVELKREAFAAAQLRQTANTALAAGTGPDVIYYDVGPSRGGVLQRAGLLRDLEDFAKEYNWKQRLFRWAQVTSTYGGKLYALGFEAEMHGIFYDKALFAKEGFKVPETFDDCLEYTAKAKGKNIIPFAYGLNQGLPANWTFSGFITNTLGRDEVEKMITTGPAKWDRPEVARALKLVYSDMVKAGSFPPNLNSISADDYNSIFYAGKSGAIFTGTWLASGITQNLPNKDVGFIPFPAIDGKPRYHPASMGSGWYMSSKAKDPASAAQFMDFQYGPDAVATWVQVASFIPPVEFDPSKWNLPTMTKLIVDTILRAGKEGQAKSAATAWYIHHFAPPEFVTAIRNGAQAVVAGTKTPEQMATDLQKGWDEGMAKITKS